LQPSIFGGNKAALGTLVAGRRHTGKFDAQSGRRYCRTWSSDSGATVELAFDAKPEP